MQRSGSRQSTTVRVRRGDQKDEARGASVLLFQARRSNLGLDVSQPGDGLDPDGHAAAAQDHVPRAQVAGDWNRFLKADVPFRREAPLESIQERKLGLVAKRWPGWIELRVQAKPDDSGVHRQVGEGNERNASGFDAAQAPTCCAERSGYVGLIQARAQPSLAKVVTDAVEQPDDLTRDFGPSWLAVGP
jgi:hypothetical protein